MGEDGEPLEDGEGGKHHMERGILGGVGQGGKSSRFVEMS